MIRTALVDISTETLIGFYDGSPDISQFDGEYSDLSKTAHVLIPNWEDGEYLVTNSDGNFSVHLDMSKIRENKLKQLRVLRNSLLKEVDIMTIDLFYETRSDKAAVSIYRESLKNITDTFKDSLGNPTEAIDSLDLNTFTFPQKP